MARMKSPASSTRWVGSTFVFQVSRERDGRGDWIRTSDLHTPSVMRYQAALRPDELPPRDIRAATAHLGRRIIQGKVQREAQWRGDGEK